MNRWRWEATYWWKDSCDPSAWDIDQSKLIDAHSQAVECLSAMLNPDILEKMPTVE